MTPSVASPIARNQRKTAATASTAINQPDAQNSDKHLSAHTAHLSRTPPSARSARSSPSTSQSPQPAARMPGGDDNDPAPTPATAAPSLDRLSQHIDDLAHSVQQQHSDAVQLAAEIEALRDRAEGRRRRMERLEAAVEEWRGRMVVDEEEGGAGGGEVRREAEERLQKLEAALHATRMILEETERRVEHLTGQQQQQGQQRHAQ